MARTRRSVKKRSVKSSRKAASARPRSSRKTSGRKAVSARPERRMIYLKALREDFGKVLSVLSTRQALAAAPAARLDETRRRISQWMTDIDDICSSEDQEVCGPDMAFPLP